jgi:hypothetical protein
MMGAVQALAAQPSPGSQDQLELGA